MHVLESMAIAIGTPAPAVDGFDDLRYGIGQARRGPLAQAHAVKTRPLAAPEAIVKPRKSRMVARP